MADTPRMGRRMGQVLEYSQAVLATDGVAPSYGMICRALGIASRNEVSRIVQRLEARRDLKRVGRGRVRRIRLGGVT